MDKIQAMQVFIRVAELQSFSRASAALAMPKGSVTRQIQALESALGVRLLLRTTRQVQLTREGQMYYERARDLLCNMSELDAMFQSDPASVSGRLRVNIPTMMARMLVIPALPAFIQRYPGIALELSNEERQPDVIREDFDCVVSTTPVTSTAAIIWPVGEMTVINCASPDYATRFGYPQTTEDLIAHAVIHCTSGSLAATRGFEVQMNGTREWVQTGGTLTVTSRETYHAACLAGLGIIQVPRAEVKDELRSGKLIEILPRYRAAPVSVSLLYPPRRNLSRRVQLFIAWITEVLKNEMDAPPSANERPR